MIGYIGVLLYIARSTQIRRVHLISMVVLQIRLIPGNHSRTYRSSCDNLSLVSTDGVTLAVAGLEIGSPNRRQGRRNVLGEAFQLVNSCAFSEKNAAF